jgi:signal transduction histidine kinase
MKAGDGVAAGVSFGWGCVVAVAAYAVVRAIQFFVYPDPNPATLVWSAHAGFFWRCWTCAYAGGIASFVAFLAARGRTDRAVRGLAPAIAAAAVLLALQTLFLP